LENDVLTFDDLVAGGVFDGLTFSISSNATTINNSSVIVGTNRLANNGIVHIIDAVLIPPGFNLTALLLGSDCIISDPPSDVPSDVPSDAPISIGNGTLSDTPSDSPSISTGGGSDAPSDSPSDSFEGGSDAPSDSPVDSADGDGGNGTTTDDYEVDDDVSMLLMECEFDCDFDSDCAPGLLCADEHKEELADQGLDPRKAYCDDASPGPGTSEDIRSVAEVCYDPDSTR
jgi:hypothetical protein